MFRDVKATSDIALFTMGGSGLRVCVCTNYFCVCEFGYWICQEGGQRGYVYKGLEVHFDCGVCVCVFICAWMCVCAHVWAFSLPLLPYKAICSLSWPAFSLFDYGMVRPGATVATTGCAAVIAGKGVAQVPAWQWVWVAMATTLMLGLDRLHGSKLRLTRGLIGNRYSPPCTRRSPSTTESHRAHKTFRYSSSIIMCHHHIYFGRS